MTTPIKIDFVSDVSCPWCAVGLNALETALRSIGGEAAPTLHFQPFELNPNMGPEGQDITEHITQKYGATPEQQEQSRAMIRQRGADVGFDFAMGKRSRIYNTFDAHRLLHWAGLEGAEQQRALKHALFTAYFTEGEDPSAHAVLQAAAVKAGLDPAGAAAVLASDSYGAEVRAAEQFYQRQGINSVPAVIINDRHLISGGQPAELFERALRQIMAGAA
ncbi:DsbA family oxidoreductase [Pseudoduganella aquatica]|uniref:Thioredoxin domain-containing protein n=1 Tax=Pseudoduganella aquatica TaxID=2660641 RepID=A0A7X4KP70_9BURK|nr:DsbA family oxidoreductase [Pseudoduganella aquatica]MYN09625.1 thioredoxin domain-containing protein [Pseudoduganella aquatica]